MQTIVEYDPGGNGAHGFAHVSLERDRAVAISTTTLNTAEDVISALERFPALDAIGVDTLTSWSTGSSGWRPANRWLRERYKPVQNSVMRPNRLAGSMGLNGMSVLLAIRKKFPSVLIVETHPKVLYWALAKKKHDYASAKADMENMLTESLRTKVTTANEHEWDAAISAFAAVTGVLVHWNRDLHGFPTDPTERLISPCGVTHYFWPE